MNHPNDPRSLGVLLETLSSDLAMLVSQEIALARAELTATAVRVGLRVAGLCIGALIAVAGLFTIVAALVLVGVALGLPAWAAALLVGALVLIIGGLVAQRSLAGMRALDIVPRQSIRSAKEDAAWLKAQMSK